MITSFRRLLGVGNWSLASSFPCVCERLCPVLHWYEALLASRFWGQGTGLLFIFVRIGDDCRFLNEHGSGSASFTYNCQEGLCLSITSSMVEMDRELERFKKNLRLTEEEENGGAYKFEALSTSLKGMLNPVKGVDCQQLTSGRFLLHFYHVIDKDRALDGCPWSFDRNTVILSGIQAHENPLHVDLNWCDFHVLVHELPLSKMNLGIATHIGNRLGRFQEMDMDATDYAWGVVLRMRVSLDVNLPLKRVLQIRTTLGGTHMVTISCEAERTSVTSVDAWAISPSSAKGKRGGSIFGCFGAASWTGEPTASGRGREGQTGVGPDQVGKGLKSKDINITDNEDVVVERSPVREAAGQNLLGEQGACNVMLNTIDTSEVLPSTFQEHVLDRELQVVQSGAQNQMESELDLVQVPLRFTAQGPMELRQRGRRGRRGTVGSRAVGGRKRCRGISIIEPGSNGAQINKRRFVLTDDTSSHSSAEAVAQPRQQS
ncbi:UNVERIFIED_CONTAM: hypothetical protein Slati_3935300 [Sesamum latifolium]|uniref:DUF4283 domain-containing protein n=1 Tax=Sesamum latifolium TaxID=2727402 RepID=A0AAW2TP01_9LAMI